MEGSAWVQNILTTCFCYCGPFFCMFMFLNTVAIAYRVSTHILPVSTQYQPDPVALASTSHYHYQQTQMVAL
jgi:hypothetical protein